MKIRIKNITVNLALIFSLSSCSSFQTREYRTSFKNVDSLRASKLNSKGFQIKPFASSLKDPKRLYCRGMAPFNAPKDLTFPQYIESAFSDELKSANLLSPNGKIVTADFDKIEFDSFGGKWEFSGKLTLDGVIIPFNVTYPFQAGWADGNACNNAAISFPDAVSDLLSHFYRNLK